MSSMFNEVNKRGQLRVPRQGTSNLLSTIPFSLDRENKSGIAPLTYPDGLALFKTTAGLIHQGEASNLHPNQLPYPINEILYNNVEPRQELTDELVFVKPDQPTPPRQYALLSNHELELQELVYPDGTPKNVLPVSDTHLRENLYKKHLMALQDINKIPDAEFQEKVRKAEMDNLLVSDPQLYSALYNRSAGVKDPNKQAVVESKVVEKNKQEVIADVEGSKPPAVEDEVSEEKKEDRSLEEELVSYGYGDIKNKLSSTGEREVFIRKVLVSNFEGKLIDSLEVAVSLALIQNMSEEDLSMMSVEEFKGLVDGRSASLDERGIKDKESGKYKFSAIKKKLFKKEEDEGVFKIPDLPKRLLNDIKQADKELEAKNADESSRKNAGKVVRKLSDKMPSELRQEFLKELLTKDGLIRKNKVKKPKKGVRKDSFTQAILANETFQKASSSEYQKILKRRQAINPQSDVEDDDFE